MISGPQIRAQGITERDRQCPMSNMNSQFVTPSFGYETHLKRNKIDRTFRWKEGDKKIHCGWETS
jgi:hypothetical protein